MRTALYARVSTSDKGQDPQMQLRELREHCQRRGWEIVGEYVDIGVSGSKDSRSIADAWEAKRLPLLHNSSQFITPSRFAEPRPPLLRQHGDRRD
jgi:predicted site-specific integrase-resolvase